MEANSDPKNLLYTKFRYLFVSKTEFCYLVCFEIQLYQLPVFYPQGNSFGTLLSSINLNYFTTRHYWTSGNFQGTPDSYNRLFLLYLLKTSTPRFLEKFNNFSTINLAKHKSLSEWESTPRVFRTNFFYSFL